MADLSPATQKIPIHGIQHFQASLGPERQNPRHPEDARYGAIPQIKRCAPSLNFPPLSLLSHRKTTKTNTTSPIQDEAEPLETSFELNDTLFAKANIEKVNEVYLWLGVSHTHPSSPLLLLLATAHTNSQTKANVMLSYPIPEAEELLISKLGAAQKSLSNCEEDLDFLREQITVRFIRLPISSSLRIPNPMPALQSRRKSLTRPPKQTMEVATARVYNWDIGQKRKEKEAEGN